MKNSLCKFMFIDYIAGEVIESDDAQAYYERLYETRDSYSNAYIIKCEDGHHEIHERKKTN